MAEPTIKRGSDYFFTNLYEGNGGGQRVGNFVPFTDNGTIAKSCIFNDGDSPYLMRTPSSASNRKTFTFSCWIKLGNGSINSGAEKAIFSARDGSSDNYSILSINGDQSGANQLEFTNRTASGYAGYAYTTRTLEDSSKWYHIVVAVDTTDSTGNDRIKLYIDGTRVSTLSYSAPSQDIDMAVNNNVAHAIGARPTNNLHFDGYIAEANLVDGTALTPSTFGLTDTSTGRWIPKSLSGITYGTNGVRLTFANSAGQTIGDDTSGNTNDFSVNNISTTDITTDSPTQNHMTFDPLRLNDWTLSEGNLTCVGTPNSGAGRHSLSNMIMPKSGKYYFEMTVDVNNDSPRYFGLAKADASVTEGTTANVLPRVVVTRNGGTSDGHFISDGTSSSANGFATTSGTVINFALDATNEKLYVGKDGSYYDFEGGSGNPTNGTGATFSNIYKTIDWKAINMSFSTGTGGTSHKVTWNFGGKTFAHTAPTGFSALQQDNFPETGKGITDLVWIKNRDDGSRSHVFYDSSRGPGQKLQPDKTNADTLNVDGVTKFLKGGVAVEDQLQSNDSGDSHVAWNWVANSGTTATNEVGAINSTVQVNTTAGFSIVQYTGTGGAASVGHGLSSAPEWMIFKDLGNSTAWRVYHKSIGGITKYLVLNTTAAVATASMWGTPTNSAFIIGGTGYEVNESGNNYIAYCWHSVPGFSKFGSYEGNANANGPFINLGFKPSWLMIKNIDRSVDWIIIDNKRDPINNGVSSLLKPSATSSESEANNQGIDLLSNGFKVRQSSSNAFNASGETHAYMAFAEHPFIGTSSINPITAR